MDDLDAFVASVVPLLREEVIAMHNGQVGPRMALWSHHEPVSLFGAVLTQHGKRYQLRVTTVFRREDDAWKVVHRHGDPYDPASATVPPR